MTIKVTGLVQGVFYRQSAKEKAESLGITGFVRNERDGSVYIEAQGSGEKLEQLLEWCRRGPQQAAVKQVVQEETGLKDEAGFSIQR